MALLDLLGRKAALRILWELQGAPMTFRELVEAAETNPSVLNTRLRELRDAQIVALAERGYELTPDGRRLLERLLPLSQWASGWGRKMQKRPNKP